MFFPLLTHSTGVPCPSFKFSHLIKFCLTFQPECCLKSFYPLCHSFNSSGGGVLLISSSIFSYYQAILQFLPFTVRVLSKLYHSFPSLYCFNRSVVVIDLYRSLFLFSNGLFSTLNIFFVFFLSIFQPRKVLWFHSFVKEAT